MSDTSSLLATSNTTDWASAWLDALFREGAVPFEPITGDQSVHLFSGLSTALRQALSVYSLGMLILAGFLLLWHIITIIAETAHTGIPMGRRTNQLWAPLRFVLAMGLLVPLSGGLNTGQFLIVKLADQGSGLASRAWRSVIDTTKGTLAQTIAPREPDVAHIVMTAVEMELCRNLYNQFHAALQPDPLLSRIGTMAELRKIPADRLGEESWRYTNDIFSDIALCGEYRFVSPAHEAQDTPQTISTKTTTMLAETTRASTERLALQSRLLSDRIANSFLITSPEASAPEAAMTLAAFMNDQRKIVANGIKAQIPHDDPESFAQRLSGMGWIGAGEWFLETARQQTALGSTITRIVPDVKAPLLGRKIFPRAEWIEALQKEPTLRHVTQTESARYGILYDKMNTAMRNVRSWLYKNQGEHLKTSLPDQLDLTDRLNAYSDGAQSLRIFTRLLNTGLESWGIFSTRPIRSIHEPIKNNATESSIPTNSVNSPFAALIETGQRYMSAGTWLFGMLSPALTEPSTMASALLFAVLALALLIAGGILVFLVPFLPFYRYLMAVVLWFLSVFAAVAALPLVALAHLNPSGEGLIGPVAKRAYWLWLAVFMRPILTLFGFVIGGILMYFGVVFLNTLFSLLVSPLTMGQGDSFAFMRTGLAVIYAILIFAVTNASFRGITTLPSEILEWLSGQGGLPETVILNTEAPVKAPSQHHASMPSLFAAPSNQSPPQTAGQGMATSQPKARSTAAREAAHFPTITEPPEKQVIIAKAEARAEAKAEGQMGATIASAGASASNKSTNVGAKAMTLHLPSINDTQGSDNTTMAPSLSPIEKDMPMAKPNSTDPRQKSPEQSAVSPEGLKPRNDKP